MRYSSSKQSRSLLTVLLLILVFTLCLSGSMQAQLKSPVTPPDKAKIRAITAFIILDRDQLNRAATKCKPSASPRSPFRSTRKG
jgi:hypothetical protein